MVANPGFLWNPFGTLMQILVVMKILNKATFKSPACFHFHETTLFILPIYGLPSLSPEWKTIIIDWSQKGNKVTRNMPKYSVCDMQVLPTCFFPQSHPKESHRNFKTVKGKVGTWQQGHEKFTHTGALRWHLTLPSPACFPTTPALRFQKGCRERPQHPHVPTGKVSFCTSTRLLPAHGGKVAFVTKISRRAPSVGIQQRSV